MFSQMDSYIPSQHHNVISSSPVNKKYNIRHRRNHAIAGTVSENIE